MKIDGARTERKDCGDLPRRLAVCDPAQASSFTRGQGDGHGQIPVRGGLGKRGLFFIPHLIFKYLKLEMFWDSTIPRELTGERVPAGRAQP